MKLTILTVPYDCGRRGVRTGAGPERLIQDGLVETLQAAGHECRVVGVEADTTGVCSDTTIAFDLLRSLATEVAAARQGGRTPVVLAGPCYAAVGVVAGLGAEQTRVVWFDAHGDYNTPETSSSGFFDGMGAAILTGRCWRTLAATVPGHRALAEHRLLMVGVRDLDQGEADLLAESNVEVVSPTALARDPSAPLSGLRGQPEGLYLHFDPDALDRAEGIGNELASAGGLRTEQVLEIAERAADRLCALTVASYDPACDVDGRVADLIQRLAVVALGGNGRAGG